MRARKNRHNGISYAAFETAVGVARFVEAHQRSYIFVGHGPAECAPRKIADDLLRTHGLICLVLRLADQNLFTADGIAHAGDSQRPADLQCVRSLYAFLAAFERDRANALVAFCIAALQEGDCKVMLACRGFELDLPQSSVDFFYRRIQTLID